MVQTPMVKTPMTENDITHGKKSHLDDAFANFVDLASGKQPHSYGRLPFFMGKSTINRPCSIAMLVYWRVFLVISGLYRQSFGDSSQSFPLYTTTPSSI